MTAEWGQIRGTIASLLEDGEPHSYDSLASYCGPGSRTALQHHITAIRKELRHNGMDILVEYIKNRFHYRQVRLISTSKNTPV